MDLRKGFHEPAEKPRRFYKAVETAAVEGGFGVRLDGRNLRTPQGRPLVLPTRAAAEQIGEEWDAQGETIEMAGMHATRLANTAIETVSAARDATAGQVADYAASDLLIYFADGPEALVERQAGRWGPILDRVETEEGVRLVRSAGIIHQPQPAESVARVRALALGLNDFELAGLAFATALFGSAVLAIALLRGWLTADEAFDLSRLDEAFQEEKWGIDAEAAERTARLRGEARMLERWFRGLADA
jgi:chaperone required for assembly of F1-ATPase